MKQKSIYMYIMIAISVIILILSVIIGYINKEEMYVATNLETQNKIIAIFKNNEFVSFKLEIDNFYQDEEELKSWKNMYDIFYSDFAKYSGFTYYSEIKDSRLLMKYEIDFSKIDEEGRKVLKEGFESKESFLEKNLNDKNHIEKYFIIYGIKFKVL